MVHRAEGSRCIHDILGGKERMDGVACAPDPESNQDGTILRVPRDISGSILEVSFMVARSMPRRGVAAMGDRGTGNPTGGRSIQSRELRVEHLFRQSINMQGARTETVPKK